MLEGMTQVEQMAVLATVLVPVIAALVQLIKGSINLPKKSLPLLSFAFGVIVAALAYPFTDLDLTLRLWAGAIAGLGGTGFFEMLKQAKNSAKK